MFKTVIVQSIIFLKPTNPLAEIYLDLHCLALNTTLSSFCLFLVNFNAPECKV